MRVKTSVVKIVALASHVAAAGWGGDSWGCNTGDSYGTLDDSYFGYGTSYCPPEPCAIGGDACPLPAEGSQYAYAPPAPQQQSQYYSPCEYASISFPEYSAPQAEGQQQSWQSVDDTWVPEPAAQTWTQPATTWAAPEYVAPVTQSWAAPEYVAPVTQTWAAPEYVAPAAVAQPCPVQPATTWAAPEYVAPAITQTGSTQQTSSWEAQPASWEAQPASWEAQPASQSWSSSQPASQSWGSQQSSSWESQPAVQSWGTQQTSSWESQPAVQSSTAQPAAQQAWSGQQETMPISVVFDGQVPATSVTPSTVTVGSATYPISAPAANPQVGGQQITQADIQDLFNAEQIGTAAGVSAAASGAASAAAAAAGASGTAAGSTSDQLKKQQGGKKGDEETTKGAGKKGGDKKKGGKKKSGAACRPKKGGKKSNGAVGMALVSLAVAPLLVALL